MGDKVTGWMEEIGDRREMTRGKGESDRSTGRKVTDVTGGN